MIKGGYWVAASSLIKAATQVLAFILYARVCDRSEFSAISIASAFYSVIIIFSDAGIGNYIIRTETSHDERKMQAAFIGAISIGLAITIAALALREHISVFYRRDDIGNIIALMATNFLIIPLWQVPRAFLERSLDFGAIAKVEIIAAITGLAATSIALWQNFGAYSITFFGTSSNIVLWLLLRHVKPSIFKFPKGLRHYEWAEPISHSAHTMGFNACNALGTHADILIAGRFLSGGDLAPYAAAKELCLKGALLINPVIARICTPLIARLGGDRDSLRSLYKKISSSATVINCPIYLTILLFPNEVNSILFGNKWHSEEVIFRVMAVWGFLRAFGSPSGSLWFGLGKQRLAMVFSFFTLLFFVPAFYLGAQFGSTGLMLAALTAMFIQQAYPIWRFAVNECTGMGYFEYFSTLATPVLTGVAAYLLSSIISHLISIHATVNGVNTTQVLFFLLVYALISFYFNKSARLILGIK